MHRSVRLTHVGLLTLLASGCLANLEDLLRDDG